MARRGYGDAAIRSDLRLKRISSETIAAAVDELEPEAERALRALAGKERTPQTLRRLAARGFSRDTMEELAIQLD
jgi:SOS response regulatory protein OraA/RecX